MPTHPPKPSSQSLKDTTQSADPKVVRVLETSLQLNKGSFDESLVAVQQVLWADASGVEGGVKWHRYSMVWVGTGLMQVLGIRV